MTYISKPVVYHDQFVEWLHTTFSDWTEDDVNDVLEFLLDYSECGSYVEIRFIGNDEDLSICDEDEFEIFANVNRVYAELRKFFCYTDYKTLLVCCDW